jgi:methylenetetrahydrofolate reductase (NADPH)
VARIIKEAGIPAAAHLTCVEASKADIREVAEAYWEAGVRHIVALRGDPPSEGELFKPHPQGYESAAALVKGLKKIADFDISVAAYPETHPQADCAQSDIDNLKRKMDAGASRAITQMFFDPEIFFRFRDTAAAAGIVQELVPGILPVSNVAQARKFSGLCGVTIPAWMDELYEGLDDHPSARQLVAATLTAEMCRKLYAGGVRHFHFYTLNRAELSYAICHLLGKRPVSTLKEQAA